MQISESEYFVLRAVLKNCDDDTLKRALQSSRFSVNAKAILRSVLAGELKVADVLKAERKADPAQSKPRALPAAKQATSKLSNTEITRLYKTGGSHGKIVVCGQSIHFGKIR